MKIWLRPRRTRKIQAALAKRAPLPTPATIMVFLEEKAIEIDDLGKQLEAAHLELGDAEMVWEEARDGALLEIVDRYAGERLPAEDVRNAMVRKRVGFEAYSNYRQAKRRCEGMEKHGRMLDTAISARQTTLRGLQADLSRIPVDPDSGEVIGGRR